MIKKLAQEFEQILKDELLSHELEQLRKDEEMARRLDEMRKSEELSRQLQQDEKLALSLDMAEKRVPQKKALTTSQFEHALKIHNRHCKCNSQKANHVCKTHDLKCTCSKLHLLVPHVHDHRCCIINHVHNQYCRCVSNRKL